MNAIDILPEILTKYKVLRNKIPSASNFLPNGKGDSFYSIQKRKEQKPVQIRISNHGTYLKTWVDREKLSDSKTRLLDPAHCINISIVFLDEGNNLTNDCIGQNNCNDCQITPCTPQTFEGQNEIGRPFTVNQFVYNSKCINNRNLNGIVRAIINALKQGVYKDPLIETTRKASSKELKSNYTPQSASIAKKRTNENKEYKTNKNMSKNKIRITENELKQIVAESVKRVLKEGAWYGDTKPFQIIYNAADQIVQKLEYVNDDTYEEVGDDYSYGRMYDWAVKVRDDAEYYIRNHSSNVSINDGENW